MITVNAIASMIINKVFEEARKVKSMNITNMDEMGIASILTGLTAFFVAGYRNDFDLCQDLTPTFQQKIMPNVSKEQYDKYTYAMNDAYIKFRETAIRYQNQTDSWAIKMMSEFAEMILVMTRANANDDSRKLMFEEVQQLLEIAKNTGLALTNYNKSLGSSENKEEPKKKSTKIRNVVLAIIFAFACGLYFYIHNVHSPYTPKESMYYWQEKYEDGYMECDIKITPGKANDKNIGTFSIYIIDSVDDSGDYMPKYCYMTTSTCGYWE